MPGKAYPTTMSALHEATKVNQTLSTTPTLVWTLAQTLAGRSGVDLKVSSGNVTNVLILATDSFTTTPTLNVDTALYELSPGQNLDGDAEEFGGGKAIWAAAVSGTPKIAGWQKT